MAGRPAPRSSRAGKVSTSARTPVAFAIRLVARRPGSRQAGPPISSAAGSPLRRMSAMDDTVCGPGAAGVREGSGSAT